MLQLRRAALDRIATGGDTAGVKPFTTYPGSKDAAGSAERIIRSFPPHSLYVELFLGGGAVLRRKAPALQSIGVDQDTRVIDRWRAVQWPGLQLHRADALRWIEDAAAWIPADALVYADPPYPLATRSKRRLYSRELTDDEHRRLLAALRALPCSVAVSSYHNALYAEQLADWDSDHWPAMTRGGVRVEWLWFRRSTLASYGADARYTGRDFRERERLKRKAARWARRLAEMPAAERAVILAACVESFARAAGTASPGDARGGS